MVTELTTALSRWLLHSAYERPYRVGEDKSFRRARDCSVPAMMRESIQLGVRVDADEVLLREAEHERPASDVRPRLVPAFRAEQQRGRPDAAPAGTSSSRGLRLVADAIADGKGGETTKAIAGGRGGIRAGGRTSATPRITLPRAAVTEKPGPGSGTPAWERRSEFDCAFRAS